MRAPLRAAAAAAVSAAALLLLWLALRLGPHAAAHGGAQESSTVGKTVSGVGVCNAAHLAHSQPIGALWAGVHGRGCLQAPLAA
jgi:hypothetical protein